MSTKLLILGGTGEAADLAERAVQTFGDRLHVISSLAGRVAKPRALPGSVRTGGFGGSQGLARYMAGQQIDLVIDATHPFATSISANAHDACRQSGVPRLLLVRPPWPLPEHQKLIEVDDFKAAAGALPKLGRRVFLSIGHSGLGDFAALRGIDFVVRLIEPPEQPLPIPEATVITGRPPFSLKNETALLLKHGIDVVVSKNSGGATIPAKITAALEAAMPVVLIARPPAEPGQQVSGIEEALAWISHQAFGLST